MADEQQSDEKGHSNIGTKLKHSVTTLKPQRLSIVKFWQGVVDLIVRAAVAVVALLVFIMGCAMANDLGARLFDELFDNGSRQALGGWTAFLAFFIMVVQLVMVILRFLNFAVSFWYPLFVLVLDMIYCGVAAALVLLTSFIPTAVYASQFRVFNTGNNGELTQNILDTSTAVSGTLAFFGFVLVLGLLIQLVWALLWFSFKWYNELKSKYEPSGEADDYRE